MRSLFRLPMGAALAGFLVTAAGADDVAPSQNAADDPFALTMAGSAAIEGGDCETGLGFLDRARAAGAGAASLLLGNLYEAGRCVDRNLGRAFDHYREAAERENGLEAVLVGYMYLHGRGVEQSDAAAQVWFRRAALRTTRWSPEERQRMATHYLGDRGIPEALRQAFEWVRGIEDGDAERQYTLARDLLAGHGMPQDLDAAFDWLWMAARKDHADAQYALALAHFDGTFGEPDAVAGYFELRAAALADHALAQVEMGRRYAEGDGFDRVPINAYFWYRRAQQNGADVAAAIRVLKSQLDDVHREIAEDWLKRWPDGPKP